MPLQPSFLIQLQKDGEFLSDALILAAGDVTITDGAVAAANLDNLPVQLAEELSTFTVTLSVAEQALDQAIITFQDQDGAAFDPVKVTVTEDLSLKKNDRIRMTQNEGNNVDTFVEITFTDG